MIFYLVCGTDEQGVADANARGWQRIGRMRFVTESKDDVRVVRRFNEMIPMAGTTPMVRGTDFSTGRDAGLFDRFVEDGHGRWIE